MAWPTDPDELRQLAREYYALADAARIELTQADTDEDAAGWLEEIQHQLEMARIAYSKIPKPSAPPAKPSPRLTILSDGTVITANEAASLD